MHYSRRLAVNLYVQIGTGSNVKIVDMGNTDWQSELLQALPSLHTISGCDSVSAVNGIGKAKWLSTLEKREEYMHAMRLLGESSEVTESLFAIIERMVCHLYGMPEESDINSARYKKFCRAKKSEPHQLPLTKDELLQHVKRANYNRLFGSKLWTTTLSRILQLDMAGYIIRKDWKMSGWSLS